ncbi:hypothetical protein MPL3356_400113 [Mesorhizobium plurifarium]|uniref:Uncharacterized protein n=1 Tax=Mesorhizobium plurifarium TaxID=69974 RepID=A0A090G0D6_MESPL|nr:hypothetical protein MPL3356_400113 [Mesorhizobium plurifarium]
MHMPVMVAHRSAACFPARQMWASTLKRNAFALKAWSAGQDGCRSMGDGEKEDRDSHGGVRRARPRRAIGRSLSVSHR